MHATHTHMTYMQNTQYIQNMQTQHTCVFACMFCIHVCTDMPKKGYMRTHILQTNRHLPTPFAFVQDLVRQINTQGSRSKHTHTLSHTHTHLPTPFKIVLEQDRFINTQVHKYTHTHTYTHTVDRYVHTQVKKYMHIYTPTHTHTYLLQPFNVVPEQDRYIHTQVHRCTHILMHIHTVHRYVHTKAHRYTHTRTRTHTCQR